MRGKQAFVGVGLAPTRWRQVKEGATRGEMARRATARVGPYKERGELTTGRIFVGADPCGRPASGSTEQTQPLLP